MTVILRTLFSLYNTDIKQGLELCRDTNNDTRGPLDELESALVSVYSSVRTGWSQSPLDKTMMFKKDPERFILFTKSRTPLTEEETLIRFMASKTGLSESVTCHDQWLIEPRGHRLGDMYMWIDRDKLPLVIETYGFEFVH